MSCSGVDSALSILCAWVVGTLIAACVAKFGRGTMKVNGSQVMRFFVGFFALFLVCVCLCCERG
eukprot:m.144421 g.144421  ORF g.144421 m.144421 type:complete len:64 (+) comp14128_c0_seq2:1352-1543(+)